VKNTSADESIIYLNDKRWLQILKYDSVGEKHQHWLKVLVKNTNTGRENFEIRKCWWEVPILAKTNI